MSITSFPSGSLLSLFDTTPLGQTAATTSSTSSSSCSSASGTQSADGAQVSGPGKLLAELKQLSETNPAEFKKITAEIAQNLQSAAGKSSDPQESDLLNNIASNFQKASQSGSFSDLFPSQSSDTGSQQTATSPNGYGTHGAHKAGDNDVVSQIFSNALAQIQTDLGTSTVATN